MRRREPSRDLGEEHSRQGNSTLKGRLGTGSQKSMTCWLALGQAVAFLIGLRLLILPSLRFCVNRNCGGHRQWEGGGREARISTGSWAALEEVWKVQQKPAGLWLPESQTSQFHTF